MIELDANVYDTLEFSALAFAGIGAGRVYDVGNNTFDIPYCLVGHGIVAANLDTNENPILKTMESLGIDALANDDAVRNINVREHREIDRRVTFEEWCKELGIVRKAS